MGAPYIYIYICIYIYIYGISRLRVNLLPVVVLCRSYGTGGLKIQSWRLPRVSDTRQCLLRIWKCKRLKRSCPRRRWKTPEKEMEHELLNGNWRTVFIGLNVKLVQEDDDDKQEERQCDSRCKYRQSLQIPTNVPQKASYFKEVFKQMTMPTGWQEKVKRIAREINRNVCSKGFISIWSWKKKSHYSPIRRRKLQATGLLCLNRILILDLGSVKCTMWIVSYIQNVSSQRIWTPECN